MFWFGLAVCQLDRKIVDLDLPTINNMFLDWHEKVERARRRQQEINRETAERKKRYQRLLATALETEKQELLDQAAARLLSDWAKKKKAEEEEVKRQIKAVVRPAVKSTRSSVPFGSFFVDTETDSKFPLYFLELESSIVSYKTFDLNRESQGTCEPRLPLLCVKISSFSREQPCHNYPNRELLFCPPLCIINFVSA